MPGQKRTRSVRDSGTSTCDADTTIDRGAWDAGVARLRSAGVAPDCLRFPGGHELEREVLARLAR